MTGNTMHTRRALRCAMAVLACSTLAACGGDSGNAGPLSGPLPSATSPTPNPTSPPQYTSTPVPFNGGPPHDYDLFGSGGTKLPFHMIVWAPPHRAPTNGYVGNARIFEDSSARAYFAFGIATEPGDVPVSGTMTCSFGEDEIGTGRLTFDFAPGTMSGWAEPFWANVRYQVGQTRFAPGATTFAAAFGTDGVLEGRFFGPRGVNVAVRAKGGGQGLSGIMTGVCEG